MKCKVLRCFSRRLGRTGHASHGLKNIFINIIIIFVSHKKRQGNHVLGAEHWHFNSSFRATVKLKEACFMMICFNTMIAFSWGLGLSVVTLLCFFHVLNCTLAVPSSQSNNLTFKLLSDWGCYIYYDIWETDLKLLSDWRCLIHYVLDYALFFPQKNFRQKLTVWSEFGVLQG